MFFVCVTVPVFIEDCVDILLSVYTVPVFIEDCVDVLLSVYSYQSSLRTVCVCSISVMPLLESLFSDSRCLSLCLCLSPFVYNHL